MVVVEGMILCVGEADFEVEVLRDWMLETCHHLPHQTAGLEEGEAVDVDVAGGVL